MGWGNSWEEDSATAINQIWQNEQAQVLKSLDLTAGIIVTETKIENGEIKQHVIPPEEYLSYDDPKAKDVNIEHLVKAYATVRNRKPTHDPYTNPNAHIYYECACGEILDPQTKSFAALNNYASEKGWKIRFTDKGYVPYCVKCGERVE